MKVILRQNYNKLGNIGDVVDVKDGFARNFLIPRSIAFRATEGNLKALEQEKKQLARKEEKVIQDSEKLAAQIASVSLTITMKVGEDDKLFGAVTSQMIADSLTEKGYSIDKRIIEFSNTLAPKLAI